MSQNYLGRIDLSEKEWEDSKWTDLLKERYHIASLFTAGKVVLDSCCGTGFGAINFIVPEASFTVGIDLCDSAAHHYGKSPKYDFKVMDGRGLDLAADTFDVVLSLDAIEHFEQADGLQYLAQIRRVCKQDGTIIGTTPLVIDPCLIPDYLEWNKFHFCMYTKEILQQTLARIFPAVKIYEIYSGVCPYFLFVCNKSEQASASWHEQKVIEYLNENKEIFCKSKISNLLLWARMLLGKGMLFKAGYLTLKACLLKPRLARCR